MSKLLDQLNNQQLAAVSHTNGPLLIIAGAGTGKTTVITKRIAYLIEQGLANPDQILALTFTDKAAGEMSDRVEELLPLGTHNTWISTFHSFCERVLKQHGLEIGLPNDFKLLDKTRQWIFLYQNFNQFQLDYYKPLGSPNKFIDALIDHFSKCKDELIKPEDYSAYAQGLKTQTESNEPALEKGGTEAIEASRAEEVAQAYALYQKLMIENNFLDFGDLIFYTIELLKKRPNIAEYYQAQFKFIMVDEFQDTNVAQYELIKLLLNQEQNLVVVGDDDQSIYKFRGASISNILTIKKDFPKITQITLLDNYRSSQKILDLAYNFIQKNNPNRLESELGINKQLKSHKKAKSIIQVIEGSDLADEINLVIEKILELKLRNPKSTWNDFAILIRANSTANEIMPALEARGIPFSFVANRGLYKKPLVSDLINYLKLLDNYHESEALYRILAFPKFKLTPLDAASLTQYKNKKAHSLYQVLHEPEALELVSLNSKQIINTLLGLLEKHSSEVNTKSAVELFIEIIQDLDIEQMLKEDTLENAQNRELLEQFYKKVLLYTQESEDRTLRGFIDYLNLEAQAGDDGAIKFDPNVGPEMLKLLTIHSAKGLEFDYVFIVSMVDQRFPSRGSKDAIEVPEKLIKDILPEGDFHLQEERRLFYVAITRAKSNIYFSWAKDYGGTRTKKPSLFLEESGLLPSKTIHRATGKVIFTKPKTKPKRQVYKNLPVKFSFSQLASFEKCPLEYKYNYYLKIPSPGNHHLSFGQTIHGVLEKYLEQYLQSHQSDNNRTVLPPEKLLYELYERIWIDDWYQSKEQKKQYKIRGQEVLKVFYEDCVKNIPQPKFIEQTFSLKLGKENQYSFNGKIDRADNSEFGLKIIDYKTSLKVPNKTPKSEMDQLRIYQLAMEEIFKLPVSQLCYWYVVPNEIVPVALASETELIELKIKLTNTIELIRDTIKYDRFEELHNSSKKHECKYN